ncbi:MAG TPA: RHS repeat-associated core domain-containing protein, partial [Thermoanaerobaculia bacterium]
LSNGERTSQWRYDDRGRLTQSAPASTEPVTVSADLADAVIQHLNDADFLKKIEKTVPGAAPDKDFEESEDGHKVEKIDDADEVKYKTADDQENGSLRTEDGRFYYVYDEKARLRRAILKPVSGATSVMQVTYDYNAAGRMIGRRVEVSAYAAQPLPEVPPVTLPWKLATDLEMGPDAVLPASTTFVWDPISDQLLGVFEAERNDGGAITVVGKPIRQYLHGGMGLDDPIEVAVAEGSAVARYYPIYDEAGDGGLQTVLTSDASIVARTIIEDPYGDGELAIKGPAVDNVMLTATKANDGTISNMVVDVRMTEPIDETTLAAAGKLAILAANDDVITTATQTPTITSNGYVLRWTIPGASWNALTSTPGAHALSIAVTADLRSSTFGPAVGILPVDTSTSSSLFADDFPFELREQLSLIASHFATLPAGGSGSDELFELTSLAGMDASRSASSSSRLRGLAGGPSVETADSASALLLTAVFQAQPFSDPFTLKNYVRARWYDPATGTWLGPDPKGYTDSANLYAFAGGDPVNGRDPSGEISLRAAASDGELNAHELSTLELTKAEVRTIIDSIPRTPEPTGFWAKLWTTRIVPINPDINPQGAERQARFVLLLRNRAFQQYAGQLYELTRGMNPVQFSFETGWAIGSGRDLVMDKEVSRTEKTIELVAYLAFMKGTNWLLNRLKAVPEFPTVPEGAPISNEIVEVDPATLRWSQTSAGSGGRTEKLTESMMAEGWKGDPIDVVVTKDGLVTVDHTRAAVALELGIKKIPVRLHLPDDPLPPDMLSRPWNRAGDTATTWGEGLKIRTAGQSPVLGPTGRPKPPKLIRNGTDK